MINPVEAFFDVGISDVFVLLVHACMDRFDRIVTGTSWTEAVAIGLELRLPFRFQGEFDQGLASPFLHDGYPDRPTVRPVGFGYPDPADRLRRWDQAQRLGEAKPLRWIQGFDPISPRGAFPPVVLGDPSRRQELGIP